MIVETGLKHGNIMGVKVNSTSQRQVLITLEEKLSDFSLKKPKVKPLFIVTPNPEQVTLAINDKTYKEILNSADISLPDGVGLTSARAYLYLPVPKNALTGKIKTVVLLTQGVTVGMGTLLRKNWVKKSLPLIHGRVMVEKIIKLAGEKAWRVAIVSGEVKQKHPAVISSHIL